MCKYVLFVCYIVSPVVPFINIGGLAFTADLDGIAHAFPQKGGNAHASFQRPHPAVSEIVFQFEVDSDIFGCQLLLQGTDGLMVFQYLHALDSIRLQVIG